MVRAQAMKSSIRESFIKRDIDSALLYARRLKALADSADLHSEQVLSLVYIGQAHMINDSVDSMEIYFDQAQDLYRSPEDDNTMGIMCNALAIHALSSEMNSSKCIDYLLEGMRYAARSHDDTLTSMLKSNLAVAHYIRRDTSGLQYALDTYEQGIKDNDPYIIYCGALTSSYFMYLKQNYDKAWEYLSGILPSAKSYNDRHGIYTLAGDILMKKGDTTSALEYYGLALKYNNETDRFSSIDIYLSLGTYLKASGEYTKALDMINRGLEATYMNDNVLHRYLLYEQGAQICSLMNDMAGYARYSRLYRIKRDSIFNIENEREIFRLKISYEKDNLNQDLAELRQQSEHRTRTWILLAILTATVLLSILYLMIRRHRQREKELTRALEKIRKDLENKSTPPAPKTGPVGNDKMEQLFAALENLMRQERPYHDPDLTREKTAEMLGTNRTYITSIIKQNTGLSFYSYINRFRIEEAIRILSDTGNDIPIKALSEDLGFKSLSTFYKLFSTATGQSPASFRNSFFRQ